MKMHQIGSRSNNRRFKWLRPYFYQIIWVFILCGSVYLMVRFAAQSFSEEMGHSEYNFRDTVMYYISNKAMESGSSLIGYTAKELREDRSFPFDFFSGRLTALADQNLDSSPQEGNSPQGSGTAYDRYDDLSEGGLSREYILTNGFYYNEAMAAYYASSQGTSANGRLPVDSLNGDMHIIESEEASLAEQEAVQTSNPGNLIDYTMEQLQDVSFLVRNFYIVDQDTMVTDSLFDAKKLLGEDMTLKQGNDAPQILIYHTHSQEAYSDSRAGKEEDTVVGVGSFLEEILTEKYGYQVIHDKTTYDIIDGKLDRNKAYNVAREGISKILEKNPTIEVVIDLHRDGAHKRSTLVNGKETAQIMLFNGLSRDQSGPITYLDNPVLQDNLAFSLQLQLKGVELYPGLFYKNYLKAYRYNLHVRPKSILIELGTDKNTLESAKNAMEPFAEVLDAVLQGNSDEEIQ